MRCISMKLKLKLMHAQKVHKHILHFNSFYWIHRDEENNLENLTNAHTNSLSFVQTVTHIFICCFVPFRFFSCIAFWTTCDRCVYLDYTLRYLFRSLFHSNLHSMGCYFFNMHVHAHMHRFSHDRDSLAFISFTFLFSSITKRWWLYQHKHMIYFETEFFLFLSLALLTLLTRTSKMLFAHLFFSIQKTEARMQTDILNV